MTQKEYLELSNHWATEPLINVSMLSNKNSRTLIYGYDHDRNTFHLYLEDCKFHLVYYNGNEYIQGSIFTGFEIDPFSCIPDKRTYPEACDFEFCKLLKSFDVSLNFTTFNDKIEYKQFYSERIEDLVPKSFITKEQFYAQHTHCPECFNNDISFKNDLIKNKKEPIYNGTKDFYDDISEYYCRDCSNEGTVDKLYHKNLTN
jgi:hypothetical protein